jgi:16S rRNA (adenine1518-N6/adenine1519-N6)-dimethyltransferase
MAAQPVTIREVKTLLNQKNLAPLKSLGQNFLIDRNFLDKIVRAGALTRADVVLEIGPGLGGLTERLTAEAGQVIAVEYDRGLFAVLMETMGGQANLTLINQDFLTVDLRQTFSATADCSYKVIANLPYYITTPIIFKLLESRINWRRMIFLVQKEVAARLAALPGTKDYGALTVMVNFYGSVNVLDIISKNLFYPAPKVDSALVMITPAPAPTDWQIYPCLRQVVQAAFGQRRKTILNALAQEGLWRQDKDCLKEFLSELGIDPGQRGETIKVAEYRRLATEIYRRAKTNPSFRSGL